VYPELSEEQKREAIAAYYASISFLDSNVGRLLAALDRLALTEKTIVVLMSDHGFLLGEHGFWEKGVLFEEAVRVPLIVSVPGLNRNGAVCYRLVEHVDLYPTLAELCGLRTPPKMEGTSFVPLLKDPTRPWKQAAFTSVRRPRVDMANRWDRFWHSSEDDIVGRSVRTERYRYTEWSDGLGVELYDHETDPAECQNRGDEPAYSETRRQLELILKEGWTASRPAPIR
jgi:uncharacterized sulfatase